MNLRKRLILFCISLLLFPLGIIFLLLRLLYYRTKMTALTDDVFVNRSPVVHVLFENYPIVLTVLALLAFIGIVITGIIFLRGLLKPLKQLTMAAAEIEHGNLDFSLSYRGQDEFSAVFTQFDRMRVKLKDSLWQQVEDERSRIDLIANIAHDLRTPITSIQGYAQGLLDGVARSEEKKEKYLQTIVAKTDELNRMSASLSVFAQLGQDVVNLEKSSIAALTFIETELSDIALSFDMLQLTREISLKPTTKIRIDILQVKRVITNIIQNSVKYSCDGNTKVHVIASENENFVVFCFADQGIGVDESELKIIFDRFYRSDQARQNKNNGSGLGLSIAKQIMIAHHGYIWARKNQPNGLRIYISFPIVQEH